MANVNLNIRLEKELKDEFAKACEFMGMSMSTAFVIFAKAVVNEGKIPFTIRARKNEFNTLKDVDDYIENIDF